MKYLRLNLLDCPEQDIKQYFDKAGEFIEECLNEKGKILVHWYD